MARTSPVHYIDPSAISITPNANGSQRDLAVYVAKGAKIKVRCPRAGIGYDETNTYQEWILDGRNRRLADTTGTQEYTIYARLSTVWHSKGYLVFAPKTGSGRDKYQYLTLDDDAIHGITSIEGATTSNSSWYVRLGEVSAVDNGQRTVTLDTGILGTDQYNEEWIQRPDNLPLRIELGCTIDDEDVGQNPYVYWGQQLVLTATLTEGWTGTDIKRFDHWEITRDSGESDADSVWNHPTGAGSYHGLTDGQITLSHARGAGDDFNGAVAATFTITAMGHAESSDSSDSSSSGEPELVVLKTAVITIWAETVEKYELALSANIVGYNPQTRTFDPTSITARIRATDQRGDVFELTKGQFDNAGLAVQYAAVGSVDWQTLGFSGSSSDAATASLDTATAFAAQQNLNIRLVRIIETDSSSSDSSSDGTDAIELMQQTIAFVRDGEDSKEREWIFYRSAEAITFGTQAHPYPASVSGGQVNPSGAATGNDTNKNQDGWVPQDWWDEQQGVDSTNRFEYGAYRDHIHESDSSSSDSSSSDSGGGHWGPFTTPKIWNHFGKDADVWTIGNDGYWYKNGVKYTDNAHPDGIVAEGKNGTGIKLEGSVDVVTNADLPSPNTSHLSSLEGVTGMSVGDCYMVLANGWLYFYDGTTPASNGSGDTPKNPYGWKPVGKIKGEPGSAGTTYYYHIAYADSITVTNGVVTAQTGFTADKAKESYAWMGICVDASPDDPGKNAATEADKLAAAKAYEWNCVKGEGAQYIYLRGTAGSHDTADARVVSISGADNIAMEPDMTGVELTLISRQTLEPVYPEVNIGTEGNPQLVHAARVYNTYQSYSECQKLISVLQHIDDTVFVCLTSYDAHWWDTFDWSNWSPSDWTYELMNTLTSFGLESFDYEDYYYWEYGDSNYYLNARCPMVFMGYRGLKQGHAVFVQNNSAITPPPAEASVYVSGGTFRWSKEGTDGEDGTSPTVAWLDNSMDSVQTESSGHVVEQQYVTTNVHMETGNTELTAEEYASNDFDISVYDTDDHEITSQTAVNGVTANITGNTVILTFSTMCVITDKMDFVITARYGNITREMVMTVNGIAGDVYNLKPSILHINASATQGTYGQITCKYTKTVGGVKTEHDVASGTYMVDGIYNIYFRLKQKGSTSFATTCYLYSSANRAQYLNNFRCGMYDAIEFIMSTNTSNSVNASALTNVVDRQQVSVTYGGAAGTSVTKTANDSYRYAVSDSGTTAPSTWYSSKQSAIDAYTNETNAAWPKNTYMWTETTIHWNTGNTVLYSAERNPNDGEPGMAIVAGETAVTYAITQTNQQPAESAFGSYPQSLTKGWYLWSRSETPFYKGSTSGASAGSSVVYNVSYIAEDGTPARGIVGIAEFYKATNSKSAMSVQTSDSGWDTDPNLSHLPSNEQWDASHIYLWNYERIEYSSGTQYERTVPQIVAIFTENGAPGRGIDSIVNKYCVTSTNETPPKEGTSGAPTWVNNTPPVPTNGQYLWNYEVITWVNPSGTTSTNVQLIGYVGTNGTTPQKGVDYDDGEDGYSIVLSPSTIIIEQDEELTTKNGVKDYHLDMTNAYGVVEVHKGGTLAAATVTAGSDAHSASPTVTTQATGRYKVQIGTIQKNTSATYTDPEDNVQRTEYYREGRVTIQVTPTGESQATTLYLDWRCNLNGTFTTKIKGDVKTEVATKVTYEINGRGLITQSAAEGMFVKSSELNLSELKKKIGSNLLSVDAWTNGAGELLENYDEAICGYEAYNESGSYVAFSPVVYLEPGFYCFSWYGGGNAYYYPAKSNKNKPYDTAGSDVVQLGGTTLSTDTYYGYTRKYKTFQIETAKYVFLHIYSASLFSFCRPMLQVVDDINGVPTNWDSGQQTMSSVLKQTVGKISLSVYDGDTKDLGYWQLFKDPKFLELSSKWNRNSESTTVLSQGTNDNSKALTVFTSTSNNKVNRLYQNLASDLVADKWYTLSYYTKSYGSVVPNAQRNSTSYQTITRIYVMEGMTYNISVTGRSESSSASLYVRLTKSSIVCDEKSTSNTSNTTLTLSYTAKESSYVELQFRSSSSTYVYVSSYSIDRSVGSLYISKLDHSAGVWIDGVKTTLPSGDTQTFCIDLGATGSSSWTKHVVTFKLTGSVSSSCNIGFGVAVGHSTVEIYHPRLELGVIAHDFEETYYGLKRTGIDIERGKITAVGDNFEWQNTNGDRLLGLDSDGNAEFSGVVRAKNFYHRVCLHSNNDAQGTGIYYPLGINSGSTPNTGEADIVYHTGNMAYGAEQTGNSINLPDPESCVGKSVMLFSQNRWQGSGKPETQFMVGTVDNYIVENAYPVMRNSTIEINALYSMSNLPSYTTCEYGCAYIFQSVEIKIGVAPDTYNTVYAWLKIPFADPAYVASY